MKITAFSCGSIASDCYVAEKGDDAIIIDPGFPEPSLIKYVTEIKSKVRAVLLTHRHFDHVSGVYDVVRITGAETYIHSLDECGLFDDSAALHDMVGFTYGRALKDFRADHLLYGGETLKIGGFSVGVLHTPGHTAGSVCYLTDDVLFSGDTLFKSSIGRTDFPTGSFAEMKSSLQRLALLDGDIAVYPGHGEKTVIAEEKLYNPYMR